MVPSRSVLDNNSTSPFPRQLLTYAPSNVVKSPYSTTRQVQPDLGVAFVDSADVVVGSTEWTLAIVPQAISESAGAVVTQGSGATAARGTLKTTLQNEWTLDN